MRPVLTNPEATLFRFQSTALLPTTAICNMDSLTPKLTHGTHSAGCPLHSASDFIRGHRHLVELHGDGAVGVAEAVLEFGLRARGDTSGSCRRGQH